jgi:transposase
MPKSNPPYLAAFRAEAIALVHTSGKPIAAVARDLGVSGETLRLWVRPAAVDAGRGQPGELTTTEREELARLRRENKVLQMEREVLRTATAFVASEPR